MICELCGSLTETVETEPEIVRVSRHIITVPFMAEVCSCGAEYLERIGLVDLIVAGRLADLGIREGEAFRFARKALGITVIELAELFGVTSNTIYRWESGRTPVPVTAMLMISTLAAEKLEGREDTLKILRRLP
jgi:DNA-binding XRE family transcriptional regulator